MQPNGATVRLTFPLGSSWRENQRFCLLSCQSLTVESRSPGISSPAGMLPYLGISIRLEECLVTGPISTGTRKGPFIFGVRLTLFLMESLKSKAPCLAGGGADSVKDGPQTTSSGAESIVFFQPTRYGARKPMEMGSLLASLEGKQILGISHPSVLPMTCLFSSRKEKFLSLLS